MIADTPPTAPQANQDDNPYVIVETRADHAPVVLLGIAVQGSDAALKSFSNAASAKGFEVTVITDAEAPERMVIFAAGTNSADAMELYRRTSNGSLGELSVEVFLADPDDAEDGFDTDGEIGKYDGDFIAP